MGSFVFSNKKLSGVDNSKRLLVSKGHKKIFEKNEEGIHLLYAEKILVENENLFEDFNGDFILGIGTFIYKDKYGFDALPLILRDFSIEIITKVFPIYGHFAFVVKKGGVLYVFNDNEGSLRLFYTEKEGTFIISNSLASGVICNMENPRYNKAMLANFVAGKMAFEIPFIEGVHLFDSSKVLVIEDNICQFKDKEFPCVPRIENLEEAVDYCRSLFSKQMEALKAFKESTFSIELTGGLDSRLVAANINSSGFNYDFVNYGLYGADSEIAQIVSKGMNKHLIMIDDKKDYNFSKEIGEFDLGFNFFRHYPNKRWIIPNIIQFSGLYGECLSVPEIYSDSGASRTNPTINKLLPQLIGGDVISSQYRDEFLNILTDIFVKKGFDPNKILTEQEQDRFTRVLSPLLSGDYMFVSACNTCLYFFSIYNEWHFSHYVSNIAFDVKDCRRLSIALIKAIDKELGSYPFVSRLRTRRESVNEVTELPAVYKSYNWYKEHLPRFIVNFLYGRAGRVFPKKYLKEIDFKVYNGIIDVKSMQRYPNLYNGALKRLYSVELVRKSLGI